MKLFGRGSFGAVGGFSLDPQKVSIDSNLDLLFCSIFYFQMFSLHQLMVAVLMQVWDLTTCGTNSILDVWKSKIEKGMCFYARGEDGQIGMKLISCTFSRIWLVTSFSRMFCGWNYGLLLKFLCKTRACTKCFEIWNAKVTTIRRKFRLLTSPKFNSADSAKISRLIRGLKLNYSRFDCKPWLDWEISSRLSWNNCHCRAM